MTFLLSLCVFSFIFSSLFFYNMRLVLKRKLISVAIFLAISGCHSDDSKFDMPGSEVPEVPEVPSDQTRKGSLFISNQRIKGDVICNGNEL
ncbi:hypothetical protein CGJ05_22955, partial [Vibrio parahaemolyticus]